MSESTTLQRPRQVTTAAIIGGLGSLLLVVATFDLMTRLRSIEAREQIADNLDSPAYEGLGVDAGFVTDALRALLLVSGALAAAGVVLAVYAFQRHKGARLGFGVAAGLLFVTTFVMADWIPGVPFGISVVLAFAASLLWSPPVRDWYAGRAPRPAPERAERSESATSPGGPPSSPPSAAWAPPSVPSPREQSAEQPPADEAAVAYPSPQPAPASYPYGQQRPAGTPPAPPAGRAGGPDTRPAQVTAAVALTWIVAPLVAFAFVLVVMMLMVAREPLLEAVRGTPELEASGLTTGELMAALWVSSALMLFWCLVSCVLAFLAFRRQGWARGLLVASAVTATLVSLLTFPVGLLVAIPAAATAGLLLSPPARAWYAGAGPTDRPPPPQGPGGSPPASYPPPSEAGRPGKPPVW